MALQMTCVFFAAVGSSKKFTQVFLLNQINSSLSEYGIKAFPSKPRKAKPSDILGSPERPWLRLCQAFP